MKFIVAEKTSPNGSIIVITDAELVGQKHEEGNKQLDLTNKFYLGEEKNEIEVDLLMENAYILHLTGLKSVGMGLKKGLIDKGRFIIIKGIPHAEVVLG